MIIDVVTIFPELILNFKNFGVIKEAFNKDIAKLNVYNLRDFSKDPHKKVDDKPYGGGSGMVMMAQPFFDAVNFIKEKIGLSIDSKKENPEIYALNKSLETLEAKQCCGIESGMP